MLRGLLLAWVLGCFTGTNLVVGLVERGADEIVHAGVGDDEGLFAVLLYVEDRGEERAGLCDEEASGLEEQVQSEVFGRAEYLRGVGLDGGLGVELGFAVLDAEATAGVEVGEGYAVLAELLDESGDALERCAEGVYGANLRADVDADAGRLEPFRAGCLAVDCAGAVDVDAELVRAEAGGDVGMGFGEDVRVDAEGEAGAAAHVRGTACEQVELGFGLHVEKQDAGFEGGVELRLLLADAGEYRAAERLAGYFVDACELTAGDDVEACAFGRKQLEERERGVGFDGETDGVGDVREGLLEHAQAAEDVLLGVDVERRAVGFRKCGQKYAVAVQGSLAVVEGACRELG